MQHEHKRNLSRVVHRPETSYTTRRASRIKLLRRLTIKTNNMQTSTETKQITAALVAFHSAVRKIPKDAKNPFFKSSYASLSGILECIDEPLISNGLCLVQFPENENGLTTRLMHTSGEWMESTYIMKPTKDTPQDRGSAITYQRRYAIGAILSLNIDDDDDANKASGKITTVQVEKKMPIKAALEINEGLKEAIPKLLNCKSVEDMTLFKSTLPQHIKTHPTFKEAALNRYNVLNSHLEDAPF